MDRRRFVISGVVGLGAATVRAQPARRAARVGWLGWTGDTSPLPALPLQSFRDGLAERGWREGQNLTLEVRVGERDQAAALAAELVRAQVDVVAAVGPMSLFAREALGTVPMVFCINGDPVEARLVASLAQPGGTTTGITALSTELAGKRLELLKLARPGLARVAVLANDRHPGRGTEFTATQAAAQQLGLAVKYFGVRTPEEFEPAFAAIASEPFGALLAFPDTLVNRQAGVIARFTTQQRLPAISGWSEFALAGNLLSYGPRHREYFRHAAVYVDKILRGAKPAELPVEQPVRFELVLNQKAARAIGLAVPQALQVRADEVIG